MSGVDVGLDAGESVGEEFAHCAARAAAGPGRGEVEPLGGEVAAPVYAGAAGCEVGGVDGGGGGGGRGGEGAFGYVAAEGC